MHQSCELCGRDALKPARADESAGDAELAVCRHCGLVRAIAHGDDVSQRYNGKHACAAVSAILKHAGGANEFSVLDAAAHDGDFAKMFLAQSPSTALVALTPNSDCANALKESGAQTIAASVDDAPLETGRFHAVHSSAVLDTTATPLRVLADHWRVLRAEGLLVLQVSTANGHHRFSARTLARFVERAGFDVLETSARADALTLVARKTSVFRPAFAADPLEVAAAEQRIAIGGAKRARFGKAA